MDERRLERIEAKIDDLSDKLGENNIILGKQHVVLEEHMRRTSLLEISVKILTRHRDMVEGGLKLLGILSLVLGICKYFGAI